MKKKSIVFLLVLLLQIIFFTHPAHAVLTLATLFSSVADDMTSVFGRIEDNFFSSTDINKTNTVYRYLKDVTVIQANSPHDFDAEQKNITLNFNGKTGAIYGYNNPQKGFFITDTSDNQIIMRYIADANDVSKGIKRSGLGFHASGGTTVSFESYTLYHLWFQIQNPMYDTDYRISSSEHSPLRAPNQKQIDKKIHVAPYIDSTSDRAMIPLRCLAEALDFDVAWNESTQQILLTRDNIALSLYPGSEDAKFHLIHKNEYIYTENITLDVAPQIKADRTFVPLRFVSEQFDCDVTWIENGAYIGITKKDACYEEVVSTYPSLDLEEKTVSLKTYNVDSRPHALTFEDPIQLTVDIYSMDNKLLLSGKEKILAKPTRIVLPEVPDVLMLYMPELSSLEKNATYYADIRFTPFDKTVYRIFFEAK